MDYWYFTKEEKEALIRKLTVALPMLRASVQASQEEISNAIGVFKANIQCNRDSETQNVLEHLYGAYSIL